MSVYHSGADVLMTEKFLHSSYVVAVLEKVSREAMSQGMAATGLQIPVFLIAVFMDFWITLSGR